MPSNSTKRPSSRPPHQRNRSASDPFTDPVYPAPHIPYRDDIYSRSAPNPPPQVPPKQVVKKSRQHIDARDPRMLEAAVRESVTVRQVDSPRTKVSRSQTGGVQTSASSSKASPVASRRSYSQDSVTQTPNVVEKSRRTGKSGAKKGSSHADVIDRMDFTGVGPMFHHDGPFDACAPSRNRHKSKAPMFAWASGGEEEAPASAAQLRADRRLAGNSDSPYPAFNFTAAEDYNLKSSKQVDRIAEAWGIHEPEPYEEFFGSAAPRVNGDTASGASSARGSMDGYHAASNQRSRAGHSRHDDSRPQPGRKITSRNLPPPQPLNLPGANAARPTTADAYASGSPPSPGFVASGMPKRTKSLMQKFRKMRDMPNVPIDSQNVDDDVSPPSSVENYSNGPNGSGSGADNGRVGRPPHRHSNSFFGKKIGRNTSAHGGPVTPTRDATNEQFVYIEKSAEKNNKALPPRPQDTPGSPGYDEKGYFDAPGSPGSPASPGAAFGRKASLLRKMKGVLGTNNK